MIDWVIKVGHKDKAIDCWKEKDGIQLREVSVYKGNQVVLAFIDYQLWIEYVYIQTNLICLMNLYEVC